MYEYNYAWTKNSTVTVIYIYFFTWSLTRQIVPKSVSSTSENIGQRAHMFCWLMHIQTQYWESDPHFKRKGNPKWKPIRIHLRVPNFGGWGACPKTAVRYTRHLISPYFKILYDTLVREIIITISMWEITCALQIFILLTRYTAWPVFPNLPINSLVIIIKVPVMPA